MHTHKIPNHAKMSQPNSYYIELAGPAPEGYRWLDEAEKSEYGDLQAQWGGTFSDSVKVGTNGKGFLPRARKIEPKSSPEVAAKPEKRVLKIEQVGHARTIDAEEFVAAVITEQSHRLEGFSPTGEDSFVASNGIRFCSACNPQERLSVGGKTVYVRGSDSGGDSDPLILSKLEFLKVQAAVAEYNSYVAAPKILKTVAFNYLGGSARGYRVVDVTSEDSIHIRGVDKNLNAPRTYLKSKIEGKILVVQS